jgi:transposase InsO family protein
MYPARRLVTACLLDVKETSGCGGDCEVSHHTTEVSVSHANARLTFHGRRELVRRIRVVGRPVAHVAAEMGVSRQCAWRWTRRYDAEGWDGLHDRSSRPHRSPNRTPVEVEQAVLACRDGQRIGRDRVAERTGVAARTVSRILARAGRPPLAALDPVTGLVIRASRSTALRYERAQPGDLVHVDVKKLGKIPDGGGWRAHGRAERPGHKRGLGYDFVHAAVDDFSRLAYAEILPDEKGTTCAGFWLRAAAWFAAHGVGTIRQVMSDNAKNYTLSRAFADALATTGSQHVTIRAHCPWQNGKVERFNRTLAIEWAYRRPFASNTERALALDPWLAIYNTERRHHALSGHPPISRVVSPT